MRLLASAFLLLTLAACADLPRHEPRDACGTIAGAHLWQRTELYFGLAKPDGGSVSDVEYQHFVDTEVTPRFSEGFTVLQGNGQYRSANGEIVREPSRVAVLFYAADSARGAAIEAIRAAYRKQFQQESVMRVDTTSCVGF